MPPPRVRRNRERGVGLPDHRGDEVGARCQAIEIDHEVPQPAVEPQHLVGAFAHGGGGQERAGGSVIVAALMGGDVQNSSILRPRTALRSSSLGAFPGA